MQPGRVASNYTQNHRVQPGVTVLSLPVVGGEEGAVVAEICGRGCWASWDGALRNKADWVLGSIQGKGGTTDR